MTTLKDENIPSGKAEYDLNHAQVPGIPAGITVESKISPINYDGLTITGDPSSEGGAKWEYRSIDNGIEYRMHGELYKPSGDGPFPGILFCHGTGKDATRAYGIVNNEVAKALRDKAVLISPSYSWAGSGESGLPHPGIPDVRAADPATSRESIYKVFRANIFRAKKAADILAALPYVDKERLGVYGNSKGGFLVTNLVAACNEVFRAAVSSGSGAPDIMVDILQKIQTPYMALHGEQDQIVPVSSAYNLRKLMQLYNSSVPFELVLSKDSGHKVDRGVLITALKRWFETYGVLVP